MRLLPSLLVSTLLVSCTLSSQLTLKPDGSAQVQATFSLSAPARNAWASLRELDPTLPADPFEPALLRRALGDQARVTTTLAATSVAFPVAEPTSLFPGLKADAESWSLVLDRVAVRRLAALTSWGQSPAMEALLPSPEARITEAEYRDLLVYLLGPSTSEAAARTLVDGASVRLTVVAPRPLRSAEGAESFGGSTAVYRWPLLRVLAMERPLVVKLRF